MDTIENNENQPVAILAQVCNRSGSGLETCRGFWCASAAHDNKLNVQVVPVHAMPFSQEDLATLTKLIEANSVKAEFTAFAAHQAETTRELHKHLSALTGDLVKIQSDIASLRAEYDTKIKELHNRMDSASATSTAGDSSATWPSSAAKRARSEHHGRSPMMETAMPEGGNANRVWIFGFKRDFCSTYFLNIGTILLSRAGIDDAVIKNCKVRAFNMKMRFSIDFPSVVIARDFTRLVNNMGYVATDPAAGASE